MLLSERLRRLLPLAFSRPSLAVAPEVEDPQGWLTAERVARALPPGTSVHFVGIGGIGMSGLARILLQAGYGVTGSDLQPNEQCRELQALGATVWTGHRAENVAASGLVVLSSAVPADNPEVREARQRGLPVMKRGELLGLLTRPLRSVAVAGTHGKTTTSALLAWILHTAGWQPTYLLGGISVDLGSHAGWGQGSWAVVEADEYDRSFFHLRPAAVLVTNVEADHLDYFRDLEEIRGAFRHFLSQTQGGPLVLCADSPIARELAEELGGTTYGLREPARWRVAGVRLLPGGEREFSVEEGSRRLGPFRLALPGEHNLQNALGAVALATLLGVSPEAVGQALAGFRGARRRFELLAEAAGVAVVDDYAHHPTELRVTLAAARERFPRRRLWAVFQPHTFSRTEHLLAHFAAALAEADEVLVMDIYPARERPQDWSVHARDLAAALRHPRGRYVGGLAEARQALLEELSPGDVLLVLGAGDVWKLGREIAAALRAREQAE